MCRDCSTAWRFSLGEKLARDGKEQITNAYLSALQRGDIDILAHPGYGVPIDYRKVAQACSDYGTLFEINNKHTELTEEDIGIAAGTDVTFVISSDAHAPEKIGLAPHAIALAQRAGLPAARIVNAKEG
jgi:putative hydrolase